LIAQHRKIGYNTHILLDLPALLRKELQAGRLKRMFFYTYVLRSKKDGKLYIGWSNDLKARIKEHMRGQVDSTQYRLPIELIYFEACLSKQLAILREKQLKSGFGRAYLKRRLKLK
jgi:putative endonuclease